MYILTPLVLGDKIIIHAQRLLNFNNNCGAVAERLRHRSCDQKVPSSNPRSGISVEVTLSANFHR